MKKTAIILCVILSLLVVRAKSQDFETICKVGSTSWNYIPYGACDFITTDSISIIDDTIFNEQNYFVLYNNGFFESDTVGYLREDTVAGKLWYRFDFQPDSERLIMDLSLSKNDSFTFYDFNGSADAIVDTVYYDEENRKHIGFESIHSHICSFSSDFEFIEGVGSTACHFYQGQVSGSTLSTVLLCCHKDEELIFSNADFDNMCSVIAVDVPIDNGSSKAEVFPNPSNGSFTIQFDNPNSDLFRIEIYSITGQLVYCENTSKDSLMINNGLKKEGIYFYRVSNHKDKIISGKIIVESNGK